MGRKLTVLQPEHLAKTMKSGEMRSPYESKYIRIRENNKTEWNILDTVKGCNMGCPNCYARSSMDVLMRGIDFEVPVPQTLNKKLLVGDLDKIRRQDGPNWVRNGVQGDPAYDWDLVIEVAKLVHEQGFYNVIMTKMPVLPTAGQLLQLSAYKAVIHLGLVIGYNLSSDPDWQRKVQLMRMYQKWAGYDYAILRVGTFAFDTTTTEGAELAAEQKAWADMGFKFMEGPWRISKNHPYAKAGVLDWNQYKNKKAYGKKVKSKNFSPRPQVFKGTKNPDVLGCVTECHVCPNQCGTVGL
tara:strand:- start:1984 stop:2874 length:891 start_codon:yes stop_codon:yes gene_type:complete